MYEHRHHAPLTLYPFLRRVLWHVLVVIVVVAVSAIPGILGYKYVLELSWFDSFYQTFMILTNEGPAVDAKTTSAKIFVESYSMVATVIFLIALLMLCTPFVHRLLHHFWTAGGRIPNRDNENKDDGKGTSIYEHRHQPPITRSRFLVRVLWHFLILQAVLGLSVLIGMLGYRWIFDLNAVDAFYEASMMLTTEGPVTDPKTSWQYVYASLYSVYGGVIFLAIIMTGVSPLLHRLMHNLWHAGGETPESDKVNEGTGKKAFLYEHRFQPPIKRSNLIIRALWHLLLAFAVLLLPIIFGMIGYNWIVGLNWVDAFYETIMVISTEGTTVDLDTTSGKVFVSLFSIYGYVFFLTAVGIVLSPFLHRLLHRFWHAAGESSEHKRAVDTSISLPEQPHQPPIGRFRFAGRILWYFFVLYVVLAVSMIPGVLGYKYILGLDSLDSLYNTVMILTNEGPVVDAKTTLEKIFVAIYSMVTTVVFLVAIGMVLTPALQRLLHTFWYAGGLSPKEQATGQERLC